MLMPTILGWFSPLINFESHSLIHFGPHFQQLILKNPYFELVSSWTRTDIKTAQSIEYRWTHQGQRQHFQLDYRWWQLIGKTIAYGSPMHSIFNYEYYNITMIISFQGILDRTVLLPTFAENMYGQRCENSSDIIADHVQYVVETSCQDITPMVC